MTDPPDDGAGRTELARQLARIRETLADIQTRLTGQRGWLSRLEGRMNDADLEELGQRFEKLSARVTAALDQAAPHGPAVPRWDNLSDEEREAQRDKVVGWVDSVLQPLYIECGPYQLADCWAQHPEIVVELSWLAALWRHIYERDRPGPLTAAADWHDRWLPGVMRRASEATRTCRGGVSHNCGLQLVYAVDRANAPIARRRRADPRRAARRG